MKELINVQAIPNKLIRLQYMKKNFSLQKGIKNIYESINPNLSKKQKEAIIDQTAQAIENRIRQEEKLEMNIEMTINFFTSLLQNMI